MADRGHRTLLLTLREAQLRQRALATSLEVATFRGGKLWFLPEVMRLALLLRSWQVDVLNTHSSRDGWLLGMAGRLARVPLILRTRHIEVDYPDRWLSQHAFRSLADVVLTTSERIRRQFVGEMGLAEERVVTVPTGIDVTRFRPEGPRADLGRAASGVASPRVGMVSVLRSWKGHETFLEAVDRLRPSSWSADWVVVGEGPRRAQIEESIARRGLTGTVRLIGHREDVPEVLRVLDLLVIPSTGHEGIPQIGLQALACGIPVVGSDVGGIPEIIRPGETGRIIPVRDASALALAIRAVFAEPELTRTMVERGRRLVLDRYSREAMLDVLESLYRRFLPA
jgi:glycosyltransferase involved in cell wall biosynthesis